MPQAKIYRTYKFHGQSPTIKELLQLIQLQRASFKDIENMTGVSRKTLYNWNSEITLVPKDNTSRAVARGLGYDFKLVRSNELGDLRQELNEIMDARLEKGRVRSGKSQKKVKRTRKAK